MWHKVAMTTGGKDSNIRHFHSEKSSLILVKKHFSHKKILFYLLINSFIFLPKVVLSNILKSRFGIAKSRLYGFLSGINYIINDKRS